MRSLDGKHRDGKHRDVKRPSGVSNCSCNDRRVQLWYRTRSWSCSAAALASHTLTRRIRHGVDGEVSITTIMSSLTAVPLAVAHKLRSCEGAITRGRGVNIPYMQCTVRHSFNPFAVVIVSRRLISDAHILASLEQKIVSDVEGAGVRRPTHEL